MLKYIYQTIYHPFMVGLLAYGFCFASWHPDCHTKFRKRKKKKKDEEVAGDRGCEDNENI